MKNTLHTFLTRFLTPKASKLLLAAGILTAFCQESKAQSYCFPTFSYSCTSGDYISNVTLNTINNTSVCANTSTGNYSDYTSMSTQLGAGQSYAVSVTNGYPYSSEYVGVYIDYNGNGSFNDANEFIGAYYIPLSSTYTWNFTVPTTGLSNNPARMRVLMSYSSSQSASSSCSSFAWGEVEDYTVSFGCKVPTSIGQDTAICAGSNLMLNAGYPGGTYEWNNGQTTQSIAVTTPGQYYVNLVSAAGCKGTDTIFVSEYPMPEINGIASTNTANHYFFNCTDIYNVTDYLWDFGDGNTSTDPTPSHWYENAGAYTVKVKASNRCGLDQAQTTINAPVGLSKLNYNAAELNVYPNPAREDVFIENKTGLPFQDMILFNNVGQQVMHLTPDNALNTTKMNVRDLATGIYDLRIYTNKGVLNHPVQVTR